MFSLRGRAVHVSFLDSFRYAVDRRIVTFLSGPDLVFRKVYCRVLSAYPRLPTWSTKGDKESTSICKLRLREFLMRYFLPALTLQHRTRQCFRPVCKG